LLGGALSRAENEYADHDGREAARSPRQPPRRIVELDFKELEFDTVADPEERGEAEEPADGAHEKERAADPLCERLRFLLLTTRRNTGAAQRLAAKLPAQMTG